ncbi:hypothetical protein [Pyxidicoccus sp. MSG2]|uniref:hypothetical protein n=1 Tax=Pyxidicoccus sp. MSG2 TaxID=2996790 RepID=UPI0022716EB2|nr:hypothetical protein [Pyxidicoccus sp. MSG2]MCY1018777.1 hypothetical protein [Pyxidicoccus sp. MSG2]
MLRFSLRGGAAPLVVTVLLALAGCGPTFEMADDEVACEGVRCTAGTCFSNAGQPSCRCGAWEDSAGLLCQVAAFVTPDDHGGSPGEATPLDLGGPHEGRINASTRGQSDRDLFSFTAKAGHTYFFYCGQQSDSLPRCLPRLLDGSGRQVSSFVLDSKRSSWIFTGLEEGTWYVEVSGDGGVTGTYTYQLVDMGLDDFGDYPAGASGMDPSDAPFKVTSTFLGDEDVVRFQAVAGHAYRFSCALPTLESGVVLRLMDGTGRVVDSAEGLGVRNQPRLDMKATTSGTWFMQVSPTLGDPPLTFDCRLTDLGLDDHGDTSATATRLTAGVPVSVRMHSSKDVDELVFTAVAGHAYALRQQPALPVDLQLFDSAGKRLGAIAANAYLPIPAGGAGAYHLKLTPPRNGMSDEPFQLVLEDLGPDDHPTYVADAARSPLGVPISVRAHSSSDFDTLAFETDPDGVYVASCEPECLMSLNAYGSRSGSEQERVSSKHVTVNGVASLTVTVLSTSFLEAHTLKVERVGTDDFTGVSSQAAPLALPASGSFEAENDLDVFTVTLEAGRTYKVDASPSTLVSISKPGDPQRVPAGSSFTASQSGTHVVALWLSEGSYPGAWSLSLTPE